MSTSITIPEAVFRLNASRYVSCKSLCAWYHSNALNTLPNGLFAVASAVLVIYDGILLLPCEASVVWPSVLHIFLAFYASLTRGIRSSTRRWRSREQETRVPNSIATGFQKPFDIGADFNRNSNGSDCESVLTHGHSSKYPLSRSTYPSGIIAPNAHAPTNQDGRKLRIIGPLFPYTEDAHLPPNSGSNSEASYSLVSRHTKTSRWRTWVKKWDWRVLADMAYLMQKYGSCMLVWIFVSRVYRIRFCRFPCINLFWQW